jgi:thiamine pyrophosphokinase
MSSQDEAVTTWYPSHLISPSLPSSESPTSEQTPFSLIVLNQPLSLRPAIYQTIFTRAKHIVAADGGANRLYNLSRSSVTKFSPELTSTTTSSSSSASSQNSTLDPTLIIGDLDSLLPSVRSHYASKGIEILQDPDQYSTDFGKAYNWLRKQQDEKQDIIVFGGLGGRVDQGLSVLHHLYMFQSDEEYEKGMMYLISDESISFLLRKGRHRIRVKDAMFSFKQPEDDVKGKVDGKGEGEVKWGLGKHIGIIPMKEPCMITTKGLEWDVEDWKTEFGGMISTSNWVKEEWVDVESSGDVLFTIDIKVEDDED